MLMMVGAVQGMPHEAAVVVELVVVGVVKVWSQSVGLIEHGGE